VPRTARLIRTARHFVGSRDGMPVVALAYLLDVPAKSPAKGLPAQHEGTVTRPSCPSALTNILTQLDEEN